MTERKTVEQKAFPKSTLVNSGSIRTKVVRQTWNMSTTASDKDKAVAGDVIVLAKDLDPSLTILDIHMINDALTAGVVKLGVRTSQKEEVENQIVKDTAIIASLDVATKGSASIYPVAIAGKTLRDFLGDEGKGYKGGVDVILTVGTAPSAAGKASFKVEFSEL